MEPELPNVFTDYQSPLAYFRSFRHHPRFAELFPGGLRSLAYSNNIDPFKTMCKYETNGGVCNDNKCPSQHFRELTMKGEFSPLEASSYMG